MYKLFLILTLFFSYSFSQDWEKYIEADFDSLQIKFSYFFENSDYSYSQEIFPFKVYLSFGDSIRVLPDIKKEFISNYAHTFSLRQMDSLFFNEALFIKGEKEYWLPVQEGLIPYMNEELVKSNQVELYISLFGSVDSTLIFTVNEFTKME